MNDDLNDFGRREMTVGEVRRPVFVAGTGPGVIVMSEVPGITPQVAHFARLVRDAGFTVFMPQLFGVAGAPYSTGAVVSALFGAVCIRREFFLFAANRSSPVVDWLKGLATQVARGCGGRGVGAIGMCLTGNFALAMMVEPAVIAPVLCQPSLPALNGKGLHISPADLETVKKRLIAEDLTVLGYRFEGDGLCPQARFDGYRAALGDRFVGKVLPDSAANLEAPTRPHSVVTNHLIDRQGEPTRAAVDEILRFLALRLQDPSR